MDYFRLGDIDVILTHIIDWKVFGRKKETRADFLYQVDTSKRALPDGLYLLVLLFVRLHNLIINLI